MIDYRITLNKYDYHDNNWWSNKKAILKKKYTNGLDQIITSNSLVTIEFKIEKKSGASVSNRGCFYITDTLGTSIGGVECYDLFLLIDIIDPLNICLN